MPSPDDTVPEVMPSPEAIPEVKRDGRGGKRAGAGAKPKSDSRMVQRTVDLTEAQLAYAKAQDCGINEYIRRLIDKDRGIE